MCTGAQFTRGAEARSGRNSGVNEIYLRVDVARLGRDGNEVSHTRDTAVIGNANEMIAIKLIKYF